MLFIPRYRGDTRRALEVYTARRFAVPAPILTCATCCIGCLAILFRDCYLERAVIPNARFPRNAAVKCFSFEISATEDQCQRIKSRRDLRLRAALASLAAS